MLLLRLRNGRNRGRGRGLFGQRRALRRCRRRIENGGRPAAAVKREQRQPYARSKEQHAQDHGRPGQGVRRPARAEQPAKAGAAAAHAQRPALGALQKHRDHKGNRDDKLDDDKNGLHGRVRSEFQGRSIEESGGDGKTARYGVTSPPSPLCGYGVTRKKRDVLELSRFRLRSYGVTRGSFDRSNALHLCLRHGIRELEFISGAQPGKCVRARWSSNDDRHQALPHSSSHGCMRACIPVLSGLALDSRLHQTRSSSAHEDEMGNAKTRFKSALPKIGA
jgi:hypothetical protein